jgi:hypothetical protein
LQEWLADSLYIISKPIPIYKRPWRQRHSKFKNVEAIASIKASKAFLTYIASLLGPSGSNSSRGRESLEPL